MIHVRQGDPRVFIPAGDDLTHLSRAFPDDLPRWQQPDRPDHGGGADHRSRADGVVLVIESGPDAGLVVPLPRGTTTVGRGDCRIRLTDPSVHRHHARIHVSADGILLDALGRVEVNGRRSSHRRVDESCLIGMGRDRLRILARIPERPPAGSTEETEWDAIRVDTPAPHSPPVVAAVGAVAPLAVGGILVAVTGNWLMLLFGCIGLLTGGMTVADILHRRRRQAREESRAARNAAVLAVRRHPPPGTCVASLRSPGRRIDTEAPPPVRLGECVDPRIRVMGGRDSRPRRKVSVAQLPALCAPGVGQDVRLLGPPDVVAAAVRAIALAWIPGTSTDAHEPSGPGVTLRVAATESLPARILALPGVSRALPSDPAVLTRTTASGATNRIMVGGHAGDNDVVIRLDHGTLPSASGSSVRFVPDQLSLHGALIAVSSLPSTADLGTDTALPRGFSRPRPSDSGPVPDDLDAVLGHHDDESTVGAALTVSLVRDGPHALVAGTTGSGKSVLLTTWLSSLTERTGPDRLRLVLLDFKGGATFGPWSGLPHVEALVTDLDLESTTRVVEGIAAELHRRERLLQQAGASDVQDLPAAARPPRIVVVVDEFRILAESVPEVLKDLMHCATVGRSLGLHLILATQRPQGVVSPEIRANVALTICLRLTSEAEAVDLIGSPLPARLPAQDPGRGFIRRGSGQPESFRVEPDAASARRAPRYDLVIGPTCADVIRLPAPEPRAPDAGQGTPAAPFIAPPLPTQLTRVCTPPAAEPSQGTCGRQRSAVGFGLRAAPDRLSPWTYVPTADASLAVLAAPGPHRNAQVLSWLSALQRAGHADACVVLSGDGLENDAALARFPGLVLTPDQGRDADEVLTELSQGGTPRPGRRPLLVLTAPAAWFGDGLQQIEAAREAAVMSLLAHRRCPVLLVGGRDLSSSRLLAHTPWRVYQPWSMTPETTATWPRRRSCASIPGRGVLMGPDTGPSGVVVHSTQLPHGHRPPVRTRHLSEVPDATVGTWVALPPRFTAQDWEVRNPQAQADSAPLAVRAPDLRPVGWDPTSRAAVILGGQGSGRTTALRALAAHLRNARILTRSQLEQIATKPQPNSIDRVTQQLETWWCVDDVDALGPSALSLLADRVRHRGRVLVVASTATSIPNQLPWWHQVDQSGSVLLLGPRGTEAANLGWRIPPNPTAPPGRAWLIPPGESAPVRVQLLLIQGTPGPER
ncbi:MAG: FtsK/SpoIIIE domain-containing protein [Galactobacter sp.]